MEKELKARLEREGQQKVNELNKTTKTVPISDALLNIIQLGFKEYEEKTGKKMTYSEMRELYG